MIGINTRKFVTVSLVILGSALLAFQNCSPVKFANSPSLSDLDAPPVDTTGTRTIIVDATQSYVVPTPTSKVDILFVDDNSGSMSEEQDSLANRFTNFISGLSGLDWQIAVTSTDVTDDGAQGKFFGPLGSNPRYGKQYIITPATQGAARVFSETIERKNQEGSGDERGVYGAILSIEKRTTDTMGFFRDQSNLAIVILSDEDERSQGARDPAADDYAALENKDLPETLISTVNQAWGGQKNLIVNAIITKPGDTACLAMNGKHEGTVYDKLAKLTGGVVGSICATDYTPILANISGAIQNQNKTILLANTPTDKPVVVFVPAAAAVTVNWTPGTNVLTLDPVPAPGTVINISYSYAKTVPAKPTLTEKTSSTRLNPAILD
jgi:hypothetical protein